MSLWLCSVMEPMAAANATTSAANKDAMWSTGVRLYDHQSALAPVCLPTCALGRLLSLTRCVRSKPKMDRMTSLTSCFGFVLGDCFVWLFKFDSCFGSRAPLISFRGRYFQAITWPAPHST